MGVRRWGKHLIEQENSRGMTSLPTLHTSQIEKEHEKSLLFPMRLSVCIPVFSMSNSAQLVTDSTQI